METLDALVYPRIFSTDLNDLICKAHLLVSTSLVSVRRAADLTRHLA
jgi:hypothetical protein